MKTMWGLRIIPVFLGLTVLSFMGTLFIEANPSEVTLKLLRYEAPTAKLGLVVLVSCLVGMLIAGLFCSVELVALHMKNRSLRRRLQTLTAGQNRSNVRSLRVEEPVEAAIASRSSTP